MANFVPTKLEEERSDIKDTFTVRLNAEQRARLDKDKKILQQPKDSTALKQLAQIGHIVLHDDLMGGIARTILGNRLRNKRIGIADFDDE